MDLDVPRSAGVPAGWPCGVPPRAGAFEAEIQHRETNVLRARRAPPPGARTPPGQRAGRRRSAFAAVGGGAPAKHRRAHSGGCAGSFAGVTRRTDRGGSITVDGHDLRKVKLQDLRDRVGIVSQNVFPFNDCVVAVRQPLDELMRIGRARSLDHFLRALKQPDVVIFDEATSQPDGESEQRVWREAERLFGDRTRIVISHRLSPVLAADRIVLFANGQVRASGTQAEMLASSERYRELFSLNRAVEIAGGPAAGIATS